jgi:hypothetical protein
MSELSPELEQVIAATRESVCPDEQAIAALRVALEARLARTAASEPLDISDAPLDFGSAVTRGPLLKLFGLFAFAAIGGMLWLAVGARTKTPLALPHAVPAPDQGSHELSSATVTAPRPAVAPTQQSTAAEASRVRPLRPRHVESNPRHALPVAPVLARSASKPAQPVAPQDARANEPRPDGEDPLVQELNVLHAALAALDQGAAAQAVALLDQHDLRYPHGPLRQERLATRVLALCALGRAPEARATASQLLQLAPRVPYLARLRRSCVAEIVNE